MRSRSVKNKGWRLEKYIQDHFRDALDADSHRNPGSGSGLDKGDVRIPSLGIIVECKNQKTLKLLDWWEQVNREAVGDDIPVVALRNPRKPEFQEVLIVTTLEHFTDLLRANLGELEITRKLSYQERAAIDRAKKALSDLKNIINWE